MAQKRGRSPSAEEGVPEVYKSSPIEDRSSTFIAAFSPTASVKELLAASNFEDASHRMTAWRKVSKQKSLLSKPLFDSAHDDDGEQYSGKKLENLLWNMDISGSVVVARWYGGVLLGPVRFSHIENCAKEAISNWKTAEAEKHKRRKAEEEEAVEKVKLISTLEQRDQSINVLRDLLAEKQAANTSSQKSTTNPNTPSSRAKVNYAGMNLQVLQRLEKARDTTISWILKEIDKAEKEQEAATATKEESSTESTTDHVEDESKSNKDPDTVEDNKDNENKQAEDTKVDGISNEG